nr:PREDICTED: uncharacterized protein LOC103976698 [Musa acuminata subsp. malaccensis]
MLIEHPTSSCAQAKKAIGTTMAGSLFSPMPSSPHFPVYTAHRRLAVSYRVIGFCTFFHAHRAVVVRAATQPPAPAGSDDDAAPANEDAKKKRSDGVPGLPNLPFPDIPIWARWALGSVVLLALPFYRKVLGIEEKAEKTAEAILGVVEKVAEVTEKVSLEVAEVLPENSELKKIALEVEHVAEVVIKDAELAETLIEKVDGVVKNVDTMVEPIVEEVIDGGQKGSVRRESTNSKRNV